MDRAGHSGRTVLAVEPDDESTLASNGAVLWIVAVLVQGNVDRLDGAYRLGLERGEERLEGSDPDRYRQETTLALTEKATEGCTA